MKTISLASYKSNKLSSEEIPDMLKVISINLINGHEVRISSDDFDQVQVFNNKTTIQQLIDAEYYLSNFICEIGIYKALKLIIDKRQLSLVDAISFASIESFQKRYKYIFTPKDHEYNLSTLKDAITEGHIDSDDLRSFNWYVGYYE